MKTRIDFPNTGSDFSGWIAAKAWCTENGYSYGYLQGDSPVGIALGDVEIPKWRHITRSDREQLDGVIVGDFLKGTVTIELGKVK